MSFGAKLGSLLDVIAALMGQQKTAESLIKFAIERHFQMKATLRGVAATLLVGF